MRKYTSIFATTEHKLITSTREMTRYDNVLGFFLSGEVIGTGRLEKIRKRNQKNLQYILNRNLQEV